MMIDASVSANNAVDSVIEKDLSGYLELID